MTESITIKLFGNKYNVNIIPTNEIIVEISNFVIYSNPYKETYPFIVNHITQFTIFTEKEEKINYVDTFEDYEKYKEFNIILSPPEETLNYPFIMIDHEDFEKDTCFWIEMNQKKLIFFFKTENGIYYRSYSFKDIKDIKDKEKLKFSYMIQKRIDFLEKFII